MSFVSEFLPVVDYLWEGWDKVGGRFVVINPLFIYFCEVVTYTGDLANF